MVLGRKNKLLGSSEFVPRLRWAIDEKSPIDRHGGGAWCVGPIHRLKSDQRFQLRLGYPLQSSEVSSFDATIRAKYP